MYSSSKLVFYIFIFYFLILVIMMIMLKNNNVMYFLLDNKIMPMNFFIDFWSKMFTSAVLVISMMIFIYMYFYMKEELFLKRFYFLVTWFILSMIILLISNNFFSLFIGWDGLGISSYFLVIFYQNWKSMNAGLVTILSNRIGDCLYMFILIYFISIFSFDKMNSFLFYSFLFSVFFIFFCFTKSAQYPFSAWLPAAMAAPTPVSSLVHSSTLVTAGFYILFRFYNYNFSLKLMFFAILFAFITLLYSGLNGLLEMDFKKIIALSTLSQLSLMFISLSIEMKTMSYFHLFTHAFFKSILFMSVGVVIHFFFNNQDLRNYNFIFFNMLKVSIFLSVFSLMGLFFSSGFISKDFILEKIFMKKSSILILWAFFMMMFLTMFYSLRLLKTNFFLNLKNKMFYYSNSMKMQISLLILAIISLIIGNFMMWNFLYFIWIFCIMKYKFFVLMISINSFFMFYFMKKINFNKLIYFISTMSLLTKMTFLMNKMLMKLKKIIFIFFEKSFLEIYENNNFFKILNSSNMIFNKNMFMYYMIIFIFSLIILIW